MRKNTVVKILALSLVMSFVVSGCGASKKDDKKQVLNEKYTEILKENHLEDEDYLEDYKEDYTIASYNSYIYKSEDGVITVQQYAASSNGTVCLDASAMYYPIAEYDDGQKAALEKSLGEAFSKVDELEFADVSYEMEDEYYEVVICVEKLNDAANYKAAAEAGYYTNVPDGKSLIGYDVTTQSLLDNGYVAKYVEK